MDEQATILVETSDDAPMEGEREVSVGGLVVERATEAFDATLAGVKPIARAVMTQMRDAVADAREIDVEFGIKLTATAGVILAKAAAEGH